MLLKKYKNFHMIYIGHYCKHLLWLLKSVAFACIIKPFPCYCYKVLRSIFVKLSGVEGMWGGGYRGHSPEGESNSVACMLCELVTIT